VRISIEILKTTKMVVVLTEGLHEMLKVLVESNLMIRHVDTKLSLTWQ